MTRRTNENLIIDSYEGVNRQRLRRLSATQLNDWVEGDEFIISGDQYAEISNEVTAGHANSRALRNEVASLRYQLACAQRQLGAADYQRTRQSLTEMSDEELRELGLVTVERVNSRIRAVYADAARQINNYRLSNGL